MAKEYTVEINSKTDGFIRPLSRAEKQLKGLIETLYKLDVATDQVLTDMGNAVVVDQMLERSANAAEHFRRELAEIERLQQRLPQVYSRAFGTSSGEFNAGLENLSQRELQEIEEYLNDLLRVEAVKSRIRQDDFKALAAEQKAYDREVARAEKLTNDELNRERIRQQSLRTLGEGDKAVQRMAKEAERLARAEYEAFWEAELTKREWEKSHPVLNRIGKLLKMSTEESMKLGNAAINFYNWIKRTRSPANDLLSIIKRIASTYLSIQSLKTAITTSDDITSAKNRLNYANANALGDDLAVSSTGGYSNQVFNMTKEQMDKMYTASQKANSSYIDMMHNTSKMMALAGDAFDGSTDAAIRFNEVMAKAYTIGGSSAPEISSSMMQLTQALASGTLQGDELRSVRENAPLVYQAIEDVAHRVWNSTEDAKKSLKQLGAEGKVSAEMIVNAVLGMGDEIDTAFERTQIQFNHIWQNIKNAAVKAFEPVSEQLSEMLTSAVNNGALEKIEIIFAKVSRVLSLALVKIEQFVTWVIKNWDSIKMAILLALSAIVTFYIAVAAAGIYSAVQQIKGWLAVNTILWANVFVFAAILVGILGLIYIFLLWKTAAIDTCTAIAYALMLVGAVLLAIGLIIGSIPMLIIGAVIAALGLIFYFFEEVSGGISGIVNWISAACSNIALFFKNLWHGASSKFWNFIGDVLAGLKDLEPAFNAIAKLFGLEGVTLSGLTQSAYAKADTHASKIEDASHLINMKDAWKSGYTKGSTWASGITDSINNWGSQYQNWNLDSFNANSLFAGIATGDAVGDPMLDPAIYSPELVGTQSDPASKLPSLTDDQLKDTCEDINGNTKNIADSMELTSEDLSYLRDVANMEWKKEYTTANIIVDMTNNNTVNGDSDLDGIVTRLSEKLREEMNVLADGVYAY